MKTINALIAPPGAGKTTWLINHLSLNKHHYSILAFPTKLLSAEVQRKLTDINLTYNAIDSDNVEGSVTQCLEASLEQRSDKIIICTHESLRLIRADLLQGWNVYIDEIPTTWDCKTLTFTDVSYKAVIERYIETETSDSNTIKLTANCKQLVESLASKPDSTISNDARTVLKSLLDSKCIIEVDKLDTKQNRTVRVVGYKDYIPVFEAAETATIMGAEIERSLLGVILKGAGWSINSIEADLGFMGYGNKVIIHPFLQNKSYSKSIALMKSGRPYDTYQEDCLLDAWLRKDVFRIIGNNKAILVAHTWCTPDLPNQQGGESSNIERIKIDNRGINEYDDYSIAICLQHGNITPIESRSIPTLAKMLSIKCTVTTEDIRKAIKYERFYESTLQSVCRTALRSRERDDKILLFVQDQDIAEFLSKMIKDCIIDNTYSEVVVSQDSPAKSNRDNLKQIAINLWQDGHKDSYIADQLGKVTRTITNWLKPHKQLKAMQG
ncbi:DEAD/DEAH box helicase family protein [Pseudomonas putida]|uniref:DEAD/DEAH box helicase family protein n=1 Tax=Pseudomonas putida TaxID=303 RepID=UPI004046A66F